MRALRGGTGGGRIRIGQLHDSQLNEEKVNICCGYGHMAESSSFELSEDKSIQINQLMEPCIQCVRK